MIDLLNKIAISATKYLNEIKDEKDLDKVVGFHSGDTTRVIDKKSEEYIFQLLNDTGLKFKFVSEESGVIIPSNGYDYVALIDPLDGSNNFVLGVPWYSISVSIYGKSAKGLLDSLGGFVSHISIDKIYSYDISTAYVNGSPLKIEMIGNSPSNVVITYFDERGIDKTLKILSVLKGYKVRSFGSASLDMILTCMGKAGLYFDIRGKLRNVDIAASANFCKRLNSIPSTLNGKEISSGIDDIYKIDEIIMSRDQSLIKNVYSIFS
ncbi:inositol monophosphatase [Sulfolobus islandicus Y.G.57.14]|jgi:myo-inositol-1(or 4)-monophosphatase|uniref:Inositol monophosphatase n=2 Tax=Saccharolobus islandicus TaxID=43080 RepID=C3N945_SACI7|nr:inositol monophosphatase family protein [Sulfolobus islandicus]ACP44507.1 inositol monophosphatase [Sulfolobus islandicus Y.G.57.14]ACP49720.1 inositol monophosphatase [Sulfolobus islandicus Y.N.15.51]PVU78455.1 inositol monophosphatase [Sulfolobus islandicus]